MDSQSVRIAVEFLEGVDQVDRERLVEGKVVLKRDVDLEAAAGGLSGNDGYDAAFEKGAEELPGAAAMRLLFRVGLVAVVDEAAHLAASVGVARQHLEQHAVRDLEARDERFGGRGLEALEGFFVPADGAFGGALFDELLLSRRIGGGFLLGAEVFNHPLGGLDDDMADVVVALAAGAARDLPEVAHGERGGLGAAVFPELGENDGAERDVDADAEGVGAADDLEQALLRELLDEDAIAREEAGVVDADAVAEPAFQFLAVGTGETRALEGGGEGGFFLLGADGEAGEVLRGLGGGALGEMDEIGGDAALEEELLDAFGERRLGPLEVERHGPAVAAHDGHGRAGATFDLALDEFRVAERGGHEEEAAAGEGHERDLPGDAALLVGVVVELVHDDDREAGVVAAGEGLVGQDLGGAAEDGGIGVYGGVAGHHADALRAEVAAQGEELLVNQRLDRAGVDRAFAAGEGEEVGGRGDEGFA